MLAEQANLMRVPMRLTPSLEIGKAERPFSFPPGRRWGDFVPAPDGRFLALQHVQSMGMQPLTVIADWPASLRR